jgi:Ca2+-binding EF-hand superfamily protein
MRACLKTVRLMGVGLGGVFLLVSGATAQKLPDPMDFGVAYEMWAFEAADTDGDSLVSEGEFARDAAAAFAGLDANRDGKLTPQELGPHDARLFKRIDADADGFLTFNEIMTYKIKAFRAADKDGDGKLSFDEMVSAVKGEMER